MVRLKQPADFEKGFPSRCNMDSWLMGGVIGFVVVIGVVGALTWQLQRRHVIQWLPAYLTDTSKRRQPPPNEEVHVLLCLADHFEPKWNTSSQELARSRVRRWVEEYPRQFGRFRDSDHRPPRHTFFYPLEEYEAEYLDALAELCAAGFGEVEIHLHHDHDTAEGLREKLLDFKNRLWERHGLLSRRRTTGELAYGFIHGNWALDNARPDGRWCGINNELDVLRETGCYADFTLPSAPDPTQTRKINRIYYAVDDPRQPKSHDTGIDIGIGPPPNNALLLIQGPLVLDWQNRKWGLVPRIENGCVQGSQPPRIERLSLWLKAQIQVPARPDWFFVKLHTHGTIEDNHQALLGEPMVRFHQALRQYAHDHPNFHYHYVSAREMYNLVRAAEAGWTGTVAQARDYELVDTHSCPNWKGGQKQVAVQSIGTVIASMEERSSSV